MNNEEIVRVMVLCIVVFFLGVGFSYSAQMFSIPTMKEWKSPRTYDHILVIEDVVCTPMNELNATYYHYETVIFNKIEYIATNKQVANATVKNVITCSGGKV